MNIAIVIHRPRRNTA